MRQSVVSVIIPVYNAQNTLRACLDSVLGQSYKQLEVIASNDGSKDASLEILREYERADSRLKVLTMENSGVSHARNAALAEATGEYLQFVDSDDELPPDSTMSLVTALSTQSCDLTLAQYREVASAQPRGYIKNDMVLSQRMFLDRLSAHPNSFYYSVLWNKLYRRELVTEHGLKFDESLPWGEDFAFNMQYYTRAENVAVLAKPVYRYRRSFSGLSLNSVRLSLTHPFYSIGIKVKLLGYYRQLFRDAGLYEQYKMVLPQYLFKLTIND